MPEMIMMIVFMTVSCFRSSSPKVPFSPKLGVLHRCYLINHGAFPPRDMRVANTSHFSMERNKVMRSSQVATAGRRLRWIWERP